MNRVARTPLRSFPVVLALLACSSLALSTAAETRRALPQERLQAQVAEAPEALDALAALASIQIELARELLGETATELLHGRLERSRRLLDVDQVLSDALDAVELVLSGGLIGASELDRLAGPDAALVGDTAPRLHGQRGRPQGNWRGTWMDSPDGQ